MSDAEQVSDYDSGTGSVGRPLHNLWAELGFSVVDYKTEKNEIRKGAKCWECKAVITNTGKKRMESHRFVTF